jgi:hypothetical protein
MPAPLNDERRAPEFTRSSSVLAGRTTARPGTKASLAVARSALPLWMVRDGKVLPVAVRMMMLAPCTSSAPGPRMAPSNQKIGFGAFSAVMTLSLSSVTVPARCTSPVPLDFSDTPPRPAPFNQSASAEKSGPSKTSRPPAFTCVPFAAVPSDWPSALGVFTVTVPWLMVIDPANEPEPVSSSAPSTPSLMMSPVPAIVPVVSFAPTPSAIVHVRVSRLICELTVTCARSPVVHVWLSVNLSDAPMVTVTAASAVRPPDNEKGNPVSACDC